MNYKINMTGRILGIFLVVTMIFTGMFSPLAGSIDAYASDSQRTYEIPGYNGTTAIEPKTVEIKGNPTDTAVGEKLTAIAKDKNGNIVENAVFKWCYDVEYEDEETSETYIEFDGNIAETGSTYTVPAVFGTNIIAVGHSIRIWAGTSGSNMTSSYKELKITNRAPKNYDTDSTKPNTGSAAKVVSAIVNFYDGQTKQNLFGYKVFEAASGLAKSFGYDSQGVLANAEANEVTMLDMLVAITAESLGLEGGATEENIAAVREFLKVNDSGFISKAFGTENSWISMLINGIMPNDGTFIESIGEYNLVGVDAAVIAAGQILNYFFYQDASNPSRDNFGFFEKDGVKVTEISVPQDETFALTLKGYNVGYSSKKVEKIAENTRPLDGMQLAVIEDGTYNFVDIAGAVTDTNGVASLSFSQKGTFILSAKTTDKNPLVPPYLKVTVTNPVSDTDKAALVSNDKNALTFAGIKGKNTAADNITSDLVLATAGASGGTKITWASDNATTITTDGKVVRPSAEAGDKTVKLTATVSYGNVKETKEFNLTVKALEDSAKVLENLIKGLPKTLTPAEWNRSGTAKEDTNIIAMVKAEVANKNATVVVADTCVPSAGQTQIAADGTITYGTEKVSDKEVTFTLKLGSVEKTYTPKVTVEKKQVTKEDALKGDWLTFDSFKGNNTAIDNITADMKLPQEDSEDYYTETEWTSSNPDVISISSYTTNGMFDAKVIRPAAGKPDVEVTLTATIKPGSYWEWGMGPVGPAPNPYFYEKTFKLTVKAASASEAAAAQALVDEAIKIVNLDGLTKVNSDALLDLNAITYNFTGFPHNWNYLKYYDGYKKDYDVIQIKWTCENPGMANELTTSTAGKITRTDKDQTGDIICTFTYNGAAASKRFPTRILAWKDADVKAQNENLQRLADALTFDVLNEINTALSMRTEKNKAQYDITTGLNRIEGIKVASDGSIKFNKTKVLSGEFNADIEWKTSDDKVLPFNYKGFVLNRPEKNTVVTITAKLTSASFKDREGVNPVEKSFALCITGTDDTALTEMPPELIPVPKDNLAEAKKLAKGIFDYYAGKDDGWWGQSATFWQAVAFESYRNSIGKTEADISAAAKQALIDSVMADAEANNAGANPL
ncbi:MAG: hypothetical protein K6F52_07065, partial [Clostridia bacterium]|nr:hypothetical protein [Clostridia bacterium]